MEIAIDLQRCVYGKEVAEWKVSHHPQDRLRDLEFYRNIVRTLYVIKYIARNSRCCVLEQNVSVATFASTAVFRTIHLLKIKSTVFAPVEKKL